MLSFKYLNTIIVALTLLFYHALSHAEVVIKFSHISTPDSPKGLAALRFKSLAEKLTKGQVRVDIYPNGELFKDNEELDALELNSVQMLAPSFSKFSSLGIHDFELFDVPYLFNSTAELHQVTQGSIGRRLLSRFDAHGLIGLAYWDNGFKNMSANRSLRDPAAMRGLKMRIQPSKVLLTQMNALGAIPFSLPFFETYQFLDNGLIDGTETTPTLFRSLGLNKSQKFLTLTGHGFLGYVVVVNKRFWEGLPADLRLKLTIAMNETTRYANDVAEKQNAEALEEIKKSGQTSVQELTKAEKQAWITALSSVVPKMTTRVGGDLVTEVQAATKATGAAP